MNGVIEEMRNELKELIIKKGLVTGVEITLSSGKKSNYYFDLRPVTLDPEGMHLTSSLLLDKLIKHDIKQVGGPASAAIPMVTAIVYNARNNGITINGFYIRSKKKEHGLQKWIEGNINFSNPVAIVDDTITTGGSVISAIKRVEDAGGRVKIVLAIVDRNAGARERFQELGIKYEPIFKLDEFPI